MRRSWQRSTGRAWAIAGVFVSIYLIAVVASLAAEVGLGTVILLAFGPAASAPAARLREGLVVTTTTVLVILL
jgi:hypothetical protein